MPSTVSSLSISLLTILFEAYYVTLVHLCVRPKINGNRRTASNGSVFPIIDKAYLYVSGKKPPTFPHRTRGDISDLITSRLTVEQPRTHLVMFHVECKSNGETKGGGVGQQYMCRSFASKISK